MIHDGLVVIVDDDDATLQIQRDLLSEIGIAPRCFNDPCEAWELIRRGDPKLVVTDWEMPGMTGMDLLFKTRGLDTPPYVIILTGVATVNRAVQAMTRGAFSFLEKPIDSDPYLELVRGALECQQAQATEASGWASEPRSTKGLRKNLAPIAKSPRMQSVIDMAAAAAATPSTVLLLGESGTGKEVLADFIHARSPRARGPLVKVNCGALPEHLLESELFGHEKGAFTGADLRRIGRFEQANGGTLFLDEIGDLMQSLQVKMLRALQERVVERVGSGTPVPVDFRLVCATHKDLSAAVREGSFRQDLFYRINVVPIHIPPLRERSQDVEDLARMFLDDLRQSAPKAPERISESAMGRLRTYEWPGNVRQLRNAIEYSLVMCRNDEVLTEHLPLEIRPHETNVAPPEEPEVGIADGRALLAKFGAGTFQERVSAFEAALIRAALDENAWSAKKTIEYLQISRSAFYERMKAYGIKKE